MEKNRYIQYSIVLTIIAAVCAAVLSVVNDSTEKVIKENDKEKIRVARVMVLPMANSFNEEQTITSEGLDFIPGSDKDGNVVGYVVTVSQPGYAANIDFVLGMDTEGKVTGLNVIGSQETPGLGSKIMNPDWQKKAIGKDASYEFNKSEDGFAGATISPNAVYTGMKKALNSFKNSEVKK